MTEKTYQEGGGSPMSDSSNSSLEERLLAKIVTLEEKTARLTKKLKSSDKKIAALESAKGSKRRFKIPAKNATTVGNGDIAMIEGMEKVEEEQEKKMEKDNDNSSSSSSSSSESSHWEPIGSRRWKNGFDEDDIDEDEAFQLNEDVYTLMATCKCRSMPFLFSCLVIFGFQFPMLLVLIADQVDFKSIDNPLQLPANVENTARFAQAMAIFIAVFTQWDLLKGIESFFDGAPEAFKGENPRFQRISSAQWTTACVIKITEGSLSLLAAFILLIRSENVFDVLLNFLGMAFVSELDDQAFELALNGYFGNRTKECVEEIQNTDFYQRKKTQTWIKRIAHVLASFSVFLGMFVCFVILLTKQNAGDYSTRDIQVQLRDGNIPFLGQFNGCYEAFDIPEVGQRRLTYKQIGNEDTGGKFGYCDDFGEGNSGWAFYIGDVRDPCDDHTLRSAETESFDVLDSSRLTWYTKDGLPMDAFKMDGVDNSLAECGGAIAETALEACGKIETFETGTSFFKLPVDALLNDTDFYDATLAHPIYYSRALSGEPTELILFSGNRWILTNTTDLKSFWSDDADIVADLQDYFYRGNNSFSALDQDGEWVRLVSEVVDIANDDSTPLNLDWYIPKYDRGSEYNFPESDAGKEAEYSFFCAFCGNQNNQCLYEGKCIEETGVCECTNGAKGALCQDRPLGDGICNLFFNTKEFNYDGGDCCASTCENVNCGSDDLPAYQEGDAIPVFGVNVTDPSLVRDGKPTLFRHCIDPGLASLKIKPKPFAAPLLDAIAFQGLIVDCDDILQFQVRAFMLPVSNVSTSDFIQEIRVPLGSTCSIEYINDDLLLEGLYNGWRYESVELFAEDQTNSFKKQDVGICDFDLYIPESKCLWKTFSGQSISVAAFKQDSEECARPYDRSAPLEYSSITPTEYRSLGAPRMLDDLCLTDSEQLLERYAANKIANEIDVYDGKASNKHVCDQAWDSSLFRVRCNENQYVDSLELFKTRDLPPEVQYFTKLRSFRSISTKLQPLPATFGSLSDLISIEMENGVFQFIPREIGLLSNLETLKINRTPISNLPPEIGGLAALKTVKLSDNKILSLPTEIGLLERVTHAELERNLLTTLPEQIGDMKGLLNLYLTGNDIVFLPAGIGKLSQLEILKLPSNALISLPNTIGGLASLRDLHMSNNFLTSLPAEIGGMTALEELKVENNNLLSLPTEIGDLSSLMLLDTSGNANQPSFPSEIGRLSEVHTITMKNNDISVLPSELGNLGQLQNLDLYNNSIVDMSVNETGLPPEIGNLTELRFLDLFNNDISILPSELGKLGKLQSLNLFSNNISVIPPEIGDLDQLRSLNMFNNNVSVVPPEIGLMSNLKALLLHSNQLEVLPDEIGDLESLTILMLDNNRLQLLPSTIGRLKQLSTLNVANNSLIALPAEIAHLRQLQTLDISDNEELLATEPSYEFLLLTTLASCKSDSAGVGQIDWCSLIPKDGEGVSNAPSLSPSMVPTLSLSPSFTPSNATENVTAVAGDV